MDHLEQIVLDILADRSGWTPGSLHTRASQEFGQPVKREQFEAVLQGLAGRLLIVATPREVRRCEPDFPENSLEDDVERFLLSPQALRHLRLESAYTIAQRTARGGRAGTGIWSRPDFTIATIRRRKYDPVRHLDLIAFELKNLAGSTVVAVHEALAHTRFAHYAYLVCPRSELSAGVQLAIQDACTRHGVGLIRFDLTAGNDDGPQLTNFEFEVEARRKTPEPDQVDSYIDDRLSEANRQSLLRIAGG